MLLAEFGCNRRLPDMRAATAWGGGRSSAGLARLPRCSWGSALLPTGGGDRGNRERSKALVAVGGSEWGELRWDARFLATGRSQPRHRRTRHRRRPSHPQCDRGERVRDAFRRGILTTARPPDSAPGSAARGAVASGHGHRPRADDASTHHDYESPRSRAPRATPTKPSTTSPATQPMSAAGFRTK